MNNEVTDVCILLYSNGYHGNKSQNSGCPQSLKRPFGCHLPLCEISKLYQKVQGFA